MNPIWLEHQIGVLVFLAALLGIALSNLGALRRLGSYPRARRRPRVSILVPARNEELHVAEIVASLLRQDYPDFEVLVLDDESTDGTGRILDEWAGRAPALRALRGRPLPDGWLGKLWACHQLAQAASGELLLFTDADTRHGPDTLSHAVDALEFEQADLLSAIPRQVVLTWAEKLAVPIVTWSLLSFLPLRLAYRLRQPAMAAAIGQFMLFRRESYDRLGGHAAVRGSVVDDLALARRAARLRLRWRLLDAQDDVRCRMYRSPREVLDGFGKNLFAAFGRRTLPFAFVWLWLGVVTFQPLIILGLAAAGAAVPPAGVGLALGGVGLALALWGLSNQRFRFHWFTTLLYPVCVALAIGVATRSAVQSTRGRTQWKGRRLPGCPARW